MDSVKFWREKKPEPCPRITVLKNTSNLTKFRDGQGRDLTDILFEAKVVNVYSTCQYAVDYTTRAGSIDTQVAVEFEGRRGPANTTRKGTLEYFVAVVDADRNILTKQTYPFTLAFPDNQTVNTVRDDPVTLTFNTDGTMDGRHFEIYTGLQLSAEELHYNERLKQR